LSDAIAIVGMACRFPDARSPRELWENVLAQRQAFRRIPNERLRVDEYCSDDPSAPDRSYSTLAAVISGWELDRAKFRISRPAFESADLAHWLALDVAAAAVDDARSRGGAMLPLASCGVIVGNTLTGDSSRAASLRLRWPYVRRVMDAALAGDGWEPDRRAPFLEDLEQRFKAPFAEVREETLAGGLSNTIAGRICGHFGFGGGAFTIDGACASSLLSVGQACSMLEARDLDVALAGGVDVSLDPFELVGFAKTQALARDRMWVYDERSGGFLPGEGCGFVVLMRLADATSLGARIYAVIRGWGISSDGEGGITRPEVEGQKRALLRAYARAGVSPQSVDYFEGHGTGTPVGDSVEIAALQSLLDGGAKPAARRSAIGSVKANIGHTKAAAGIAGLIKTTMAVSSGVIPPMTACAAPRRDFAAPGSRLRVARSAETWSATPRRAGVSAFGFGGVNAHLVVECDAIAEPLTETDAQIAASAQDAELFLLDASTEHELHDKARRLATLAKRISFAELTDLSASLANGVALGDFRAAMVASSPRELEARALELIHGETGGAVFSGLVSSPLRIGLLFSGQAAPVRTNAGLWGRRFRALQLDELWRAAGVGDASDTEETAVAQPAIVAASLSALRVLRALRIDGCAAIGHSLGELTALHWSGAIDEGGVIRLAAARGALMQPLADGGRMAALAADANRVAPLLRDGVVIAAINTPDQTVISGPSKAVARICEDAKVIGIAAAPLPVSAAFHSRMMAAAAEPLRKFTASLRWTWLQRRAISTVTGAELPRDVDAGALLVEQLTGPVRFLDAVRAIEDDVDLFIEAGPGDLLAELVRRVSIKPAVSLDAAGESIQGLLKAAALLFTRSRDFDVGLLFRGRFCRPFDDDPRFIGSPCERDANIDEQPTLPRVASPKPVVAAEVVDRKESAEILLRRLIARRTDLPFERVMPADRLLADLHLSSISVSHLVVELARALDLPPFADPTQFAAATVAEVARAIEELRSTSGTRTIAQERFPRGIDDWVRTFVAARVPQPIDPRRASDEPARWEVIGDGGPLADAIRANLDRAGGEGIVAIVPGDEPRAAIDVLLDAASRAPKGGRVVFVQDRDAAGGFARSLFLERGNLSVRIVSVPSLDRKLAGVIADEACGRRPFAHAFYDDNGTRFEERYRLCEPTLEAISWSPDDVLLVTGGGKGIAAETAFHIARAHRIRLAVIGRSDPAHDDVLAATLDRFSSAGMTFHYEVADVTSATATDAAVASAVAALGPITAVIHGAGANSPRLIESLNAEMFAATLAPKVAGLRNVIAAIDASRLKLLIALGSVIARSGLRGEADYAFANEWLAREVTRFGAAHARCRAITIESSIWSGAGMGERLGRVEALRRDGIAPLSVDEAVAEVDRIASRGATGSIVVAGRMGNPPTMIFDSPMLPLARFLEHPRVVQQGVEIVADSRLTHEADPYLGDHRFRGEALFPAVMGIEAMLQAASATVGCDAASLSLHDVVLARPIVVATRETTTIRVATLVRGDDVEAVVRSSETEFTVDHFRATCHRTARSEAPPPIEIPSSDVSLDVARDLYGPLLFQTGRLRRVRRYLRLSSTECVAEIAANDVSWFGRFLPGNVAGGDPGIRDSAIHAIQACIPHATVLPAGVERIERYAALPSEGTVIAVAHERLRDGDRFLYDLDIATVDGMVLERWSRLDLRVVERRKGAGTLAPALWGPFLERELPPPFGRASLSIAVANGIAPTDREVARVTGLRAFRRGDGKPVTASSSMYLSASHAGTIRMTVSAARPIAVDLQEVSVPACDALLDESQLALARTISAARGEPLETAAVRVWGARECLTKIGARVDAPLILRAGDGPLVLLTSGDREIASTVMQAAEGTPTIVTLAILKRPMETEAALAAAANS
jgi:enediyne polyketide synthase